MPRKFGVTGEPLGPDEPFDADAIKRAATVHLIFSYTQLNNEPYRIYTVASVRDGKVAVIVQTGYPLGDVYPSLDSLRNTLLTVGIPSGIILGALVS